jgi:sugar (pentulose or hexulose) kinase
MYSDRRAGGVADEIAAAYPGLGVNVSWGLPKIVWFERTFPELAARIHAWRHPADFLIGRLTGEWKLTDQTTALKSGFDLVRNAWPVDVFAALGVEVAKMPVVGTTGEVAGRIRVNAAEETGLPVGTPVMLGMTDGCASQVSAGAVRPGAWNSTIGTTLVIKGTTVGPVIDPLGRIYNHRHPQGYWMPGAASNTGAAWISAWFPEQDLGELDRLAARVVPTGDLTYPLVGTGERFPFVSAAATGFGYDGPDEVVRYASALEGVAYLERMAFDLVEELSGERVEAVSTAGGGSAGETWLQIRANVLDRPVRKVRNANAASGAAMIAASGCWYAGLIEAVEAMVKLETVVEPDGLVGAYRVGYERFRAEMVRRGYCS